MLLNCRWSRKVKRLNSYNASFNCRELTPGFSKKFLPLFFRFSPPLPQWWCLGRISFLPTCRWSVYYAIDSVGDQIIICMEKYTWSSSSEFMILGAHLCLSYVRWQEEIPVCCTSSMPCLPFIWPTAGLYIYWLIMFLKTGGLSIQQPSPHPL